jgi:hypothetical protein
MSTAGRIIDAEQAMSGAHGAISGKDPCDPRFEEREGGSPPSRVEHRPEPETAPLAPEHYEAIEKARRRRRAIDRAVGVAGFNGWSAAVIAGLSLPFALFDVVSFLLCAGIIMIAFNEFRGRRRLRALDPTAPRFLGFNQIAFCVMLCGYCFFNIFNAITGPGPYADVIAAQPELSGSLGSIDSLHKSLSIAVYGAMLALSLLFQGGTAWYYLSRSKHLRSYCAETPEWILALDRKSRSSRPPRS